jgi:hypothetical protein
VDQKFKVLIRVAALAVIWYLWLCRNDVIFNSKKLSYAGHLPVQYFASFMVVASAYEEP